MVEWPLERLSGGTFRIRSFLKSWRLRSGRHPSSFRSKDREILELGAEVLAESEASDALLARYQEHGIVSQSFIPDGLHIALATAAQVDLLVSWNFRHIVRFDKIRAFNAVSRELGYKEIEIYSPREVTRYEERRNKGGGFGEALSREALQAAQGQDTRGAASVLSPGGRSPAPEARSEAGEETNSLSTAGA